MTFLEFLGTAGGTGAIGVLCKRVVDLYRARSANRVEETKVESDVHLSEVDKAAELYRDIVQGLRTDLTQLKADMATLLETHLACREENASLKSEVVSLRTEVQSLRDVLAGAAKK
jgi:uncharacterized coiled-coil DUF342 family protein